MIGKQIADGVWRYEVTVSRFHRSYVGLKVFIAENKAAGQHASPWRADRLPSDDRYWWPYLAAAAARCCARAFSKAVGASRVLCLRGLRRESDLATVLWPLVEFSWPSLGRTPVCVALLGRLPICRRTPPSIKNATKQFADRRPPRIDCDGANALRFGQHTLLAQARVFGSCALQCGRRLRVR